MQQFERLAGTRTWRHEAAGAGNPMFNRLQYSVLDRGIDSEVVRIDDQHPRLWGITQHFAGKHTGLLEGC
jgi:hypothetical protein